MLKVLVPVNGSANALQAVSHTIAEYKKHHQLELHLLNVQPKLSRYISKFFSKEDRQQWHQEQADQAISSAKQMLAQANVPYQSHFASGDSAEEICNAAKRLDVHHVVMGTARKNSFTRMVEDSTTNRVLESTTVPVEVISGNAVSKWERWGLPAGALSTGGLLLLAALD